MPTESTARVVFVGAFPPPHSEVHGGMVTSCRALLEGGLGERLDLTLVDTTQRTIPAPPAWQRLRYALSRMLEVRSAIARRPAAAMFFTTVGFSLVEKSICAWYGRTRGVPTVMFMRGGPLMQQCRRSPAYRAFARALLHAPTRIVCQGPSWYTFFTEELGLPRERCSIIENWTADPALLAIGERRRYEDAPGRPLRILFLGWVQATKGVLELIEALARLRARPDLPRFELVMCGGGRSEATAREFAEALGCADAVDFRGWVAGAAKLAALEEADVFALPSHSEGLPNAMIEAMAAGLPVVVTPVGSIPDVVIDGSNGRIVPVRDVDALTDALAGLIAAADRERLGTAAREEARMRFSSESAVDRIAMLVDSVRTP